MAALRARGGAVSGAELAATWPDAAQRERAVASLVADGLVETVGGRFRLPHG
jgi:A/G-specific adenine glycosylase